MVNKGKICSVEGCAKIHYGKGFCSFHYYRWKKYGDPLFIFVQTYEDRIKYKSPQPCHICGTIVNPLKLENRKRSSYHATGRYYCSEKCSMAYRRKKSSEAMSKTNKKYASERMKINNPMKRPEIRKKVSDIHKERGHKPKIQGGNGRGLTIPQKMLLDLLSDEWIPEYVVKTNVCRDNNPLKYPPCYKIDIANPKIMVAVEVDGASHHPLSRQAMDKKKTHFLEQRGWRVIRIKNNDILLSADECKNRLIIHEK